MTNSPLSQYPVDMVAAVEIAMSAGYFYNDDLVPFVFKTIEAGRREYVLSSIVDLDISAVGFLATCTETVARLNADAPKLPRGHYIVLRIHQGHNKFHYRTFVSDGFGNRSAESNGGEYFSMPYADNVLKRAVCFEIYKCRAAVDEYNTSLRNETTIKNHGLHVGYVFNGAYKEFFPVDYTYSIEIIGISEDGKLEINKLRTSGLGPILPVVEKIDADVFVSNARLSLSVKQIQKVANVMKVQADLFDLEMA